MGESLFSALDAPPIVPASWLFRALLLSVILHGGLGVCCMGRMSAPIEAASVLTLSLTEVVQPNPSERVHDGVGDSSQSQGEEGAAVSTTAVTKPVPPKEASAHRARSAPHTKMASAPLPLLQKSLTGAERATHAKETSPRLDRSLRADVSPQSSGAAQDIDTTTQNAAQDTLPSSRAGQGADAAAAANTGIGAYLPTQLDTPPRLLRKITPQYPVAARRQGVCGRVVVRLIVNTKGCAESLSIREAIPQGYFEQASLEAARRMQFSPGRKAGRAVATWIEIPFIFQLK